MPRGYKFKPAPKAVGKHDYFLQREDTIPSMADDCSHCHKPPFSRPEEGGSGWVISCPEYRCQHGGVIGKNRRDAIQKYNEWNEKTAPKEGK